MKYHFVAMGLVSVRQNKLTSHPLSAKRDRLKICESLTFQYRKFREDEEPGYYNWHRLQNIFKSIFPRERENYYAETK